MGPPRPVLTRLLRDPRQTHFFFNVQPDPSAGALDPGKKQPTPTSGDGQEEVGAAPAQRM